MRSTPRRDSYELLGRPMLGPLLEANPWTGPRGRPRTPPHQLLGPYSAEAGPTPPIPTWVGLTSDGRGFQSGGPEPF